MVKQRFAHREKPVQRHPDGAKEPTVDEKQWIGENEVSANDVGFQQMDCDGETPSDETLEEGEKGADEEGEDLRKGKGYSEMEENVVEIKN